MRWAFITIVGVLAGFAPAVNASLLAYEGFNYLPGSNLKGQAGGGSFGFSTGWYRDTIATGGQGYSIVGASLSDPTGRLGSSGGSCAGLDAPGAVPMRRDLAVPMGNDATTRYISFLGRFLYDSFQDPNVLDFNGIAMLGARAGYRLDVGRSSILSVWDMTSWVPPPLFVGGTVSVHVPAPENPALFVLKVEFHPGADNFALYVNPMPGAPEPPIAAAAMTSDLGPVSGIGIRGDYRFAIDEIRVGERFADVTPVPEPSLLLAAVCAGGSLLMRRGRMA